MRLYEFVSADVRKFTNDNNFVD